ncbi:MAG TPA: hypothetical protein VEI80_03210 [Candidatus Acidoferrales bacterium]|nr:hypothetical protein [Candidatus Acidoferrales bacterium]
MPSPNGLSEPQEAVLFAIWKLKGIGTNPVTEDQLKTQIGNTPTEFLPPTLTQLQTQGFVQIDNDGGRKTISITPLGLAILRKVEEDRLQEI